MTKKIKVFLFILINILFIELAFSQNKNNYFEKNIQAIKNYLESKKYSVKFWVPYPVVKRISIADRDIDGIPDRFDKCPSIPGIPELEGCPDIDITKIITVSTPTIIFSDDDFMNLVKIFESLQFNKNKLKPSSFSALDSFVEILNNNPKWNITLSVYVDEGSDKKSNLLSSKHRLDEITNYLIKKGVSKKRIIGIYFGDTMPVLDLPLTRFEVEFSE